MLEFNHEEIALIKSMDIGRLATISGSGWPHCTPVSYVSLEGTFHVPAYKGSRKIMNLAENPKATILIDKDEMEHGIMIECNSRVLSGRDADEMRESMRKIKRWQNDQDTVIIKLDPVRKASW